jgi:hypothetical protein
MQAENPSTFIIVDPSMPRNSPSSTKSSKPDPVIDFGNKKFIEIQKSTPKQ